MDRALRQTLTYVLTIAAGQGLSFLLLPVVTAYLAPAVYGEYTLAFSLSGLVATLGASWVRNVSFRLFYDARTAGRTRAFFVTVAAFQAALVLVLYVPFALAVGSWLEYVPLPVMLAAGAAVVASDFYSHAVSLLRAEQRAAQYSFAEISSAAVRFAATLAALAAGLRLPVLLFVAAALGFGAARALGRPGPAAEAHRLRRDSTGASSESSPASDRPRSPSRPRSGRAASWIASCSTITCPARWWGSTPPTTRLAIASSAGS